MNSNHQQGGFNAQAPAFIPGGSYQFSNGQYQGPPQGQYQAPIQGQYQCPPQGQYQCPPQGQQQWMQGGYGMQQGHSPYDNDLHNTHQAAAYAASPGYAHPTPQAYYSNQPYNESPHDSCSRNGGYNQRPEFQSHDNNVNSHQSQSNEWRHRDGSFSGQRPAHFPNKAAAPKSKAATPTSAKQIPKDNTAATTSVSLKGSVAKKVDLSKPVATKGPVKADDKELEKYDSGDDCWEVKETKAADPTAVVVKSTVSNRKSSSNEKASDDASEANEDEETKVLDASKPSKFKDPDPRPHLNVVFVGHVDAGKSTTCGNILFLTGQVDARTIEKYEREAKEKNRDTWFFAFITDSNEEERAKGKTVEVGRATFELDDIRFTILDAPGHKSFVPNMISGAAQADVAVLIISARKGEFETGFERGGQTREHAMLAKTLGVSQLVVAVNKLDDPTCQWSEARFKEIELKLTPFLRGCGYNPAKDITFVPISGLAGQNLKLHATDPSFKLAEQAKWYGKDRPTLFQVLNQLKPPERNEKDPLRIPLLEGFRDQGVMACGKIEAGIITAGQSAILMPKKIKVKVLGIQISEEEVSHARPGENVTLRLSGVEETDIAKGMILCPVNSPCPIVTTFKAQVMIVELLEHRPLITAGYSCVIHAHTACEEIQLIKILESIDKASKKKKLNPQFVKGNSIIICEMQMAVPICMEVFDERPQLGRFTLRDEGKTIAIGKILGIIS